MLLSVVGCSSPRTRRRTSSALSRSGSALANWPWSAYSAARLFMELSVSGCSSPRTRRRTSSTLTESGSALSNWPWLLVQPRQVVHDGERVGVLLSQDAAADFQHLDEERLGLGELALGLVQPCHGCSWI